MRRGAPASFRCTPRRAAGANGAWKGRQAGVVSRLTQKFVLASRHLLKRSADRSFVDLRLKDLHLR